jgi:hypothetical protein
MRGFFINSFEGIDKKVDVQSSKTIHRPKDRPSSNSVYPPTLRAMN